MGLYKKCFSKAKMISSLVTVFLITLFISIFYTQWNQWETMKSMSSAGEDGLVWAYFQLGNELAKLDKSVDTAIILEKTTGATEDDREKVHINYEIVANRIEIISGPGYKNVLDFEPENKKYMDAFTVFIEQTDRLLDDDTLSSRDLIEIRKNLNSLIPISRALMLSANKYINTFAAERKEKIGNNISIEAGLTIFQAILITLFALYSMRNLHRLQKRQKELEDFTEELQIAKKEAEDAAKMKSAFLATMSHELRTPMTGVIGMIDLFGDQSLNQDQREKLDIMRRSADDLLSVLDDILDFSKLEAGKMIVESVPFSPVSLIKDSLSLFSASSKSKKTKLFFEPYCPENLIIMGDPLRLKQIINNLVGNAIKFSQNGKITVVLKADTSEDSVALTIKVKDTGIGMTEDQIKSLFKPFIQADNTTSRKFGGTGLGLAICKKLIEAMNGTISVTSKIGIGSIFEISLTLPLSEDSISVLPENTNPVYQKTECGQSNCLDCEEKSCSMIHGMKILVAEDNPTNQILIRTKLSQDGALVTLVENGKLALEEVQKNTYDCVLMDMQMPVMDGPTATQTIRSLNHPVRLIPIIGLTADAMTELRQKHMKSGLDDYITKPIRWNQLFQAIHNATQKHTSKQNKNSSLQEISLKESPSTLLSSTEITGQDASTINRTQVRELIEMLGEDSYATLLDSLLAGLQKEIHSAKEAAGNQDFESLRKKAHSIKGSAANLGFDILANIAADLEKSAKTQSMNPPPEKYLTIIEESLSHIQEKRNSGEYLKILETALS